MKKSNFKWWGLGLGIFSAVSVFLSTNGSSYEFAGDLIFNGLFLFAIGSFIDWVRKRRWKKFGDNPPYIMKYWLLAFGFWLAFTNWISQWPLTFAPFVWKDFLQTMTTWFAIGFVIDLFLTFLRNNKLGRQALDRERALEHIRKTHPEAKQGDVIVFEGKTYTIKGDGIQFD